MSSQTAPLDRLLHGLFDDASLFPPASLALPEAVAGYVRHHSAWYRAMAGPFVCPETSIGGLRMSLTAALLRSIDLGVNTMSGRITPSSACRRSRWK